MTYLKEYIAQWDNNVKYMCTSFNIPYHEAEEFLSRAMWRISYRMQVQKVLDDFQSYRHLHNFIFKTTKNLLIDERKKPKLDTQYIDYDLNIVDDTPSNDRRKLKHHLHKLPKNLRKVAILRSWGFKYEEIAEFLNIPVGTAKHHMVKIKRRLS